MLGAAFGRCQMKERSGGADGCARRAGGCRRLSRVSELPPHFLAQVRALEPAYLASADPIRQSGFGGGPQRWREERSVILDAIEGDGDLLDIGCANGYLLECLVAWARERGIHLTPHGLDLGERLIATARARLPQYAANFPAGNAWDWRPLAPFRYVYTLSDCVPEPLLAPYVRRLLAQVVAPGGRLIVGAYGSLSRSEAAFAVAQALASYGLRVAGSARVGELPLVEIAWVDNDGP